MMKMFGIKYLLQNDQQMDVGVIAQNREQAVHALMDKQKGVKSVVGIMLGPEVHLLSKEVKEPLVNSGGEVKELKKQNQYLKNCLMDSDEHIASLMKESDKKNNPIINTGENEMLMNKIVELETKLMSKPKDDNSLVDTLNEKVLQLENELANKPTEYVCLECGKTYKTFTGLETHYNKLHKGK